MTLDTSAAFLGALAGGNGAPAGALASLFHPGGAAEPGGLGRKTRNASKRPEAEGPGTGDQGSRGGPRGGSEGPGEQSKEAHALRSRLYILRGAARRLSERSTVQLCGIGGSFKRSDNPDAGVISMVVNNDRGARVSGTHACGSVHECPVCRARIQLERARELSEGLAEWRRRGGVVFFVTLTVRHRYGNNLKATRKGIANAWRKVTGSGSWSRMKSWLDLRNIRALEVTHGANGWHPHLHIVFLARVPEGETIGMVYTTLRDQLRMRWPKAVVSMLGEDARPFRAIGTVVQDWSSVDVQTLSKSARYLSKLGLEVASDLDKKAHDGSRTPLQILADAEQGDVASARLWQEYARDMVGAHGLDWGPGLKAELGLKDVPDAELAKERPADLATERVAIRVDSILWARHLGWDARLVNRVLDVLERHGVDATWREIERWRGKAAREELQASDRWLDRGLGRALSRGSFRVSIHGAVKAIRPSKQRRLLRIR